MSNHELNCSEAMATVKELLSELPRSDREAMLMLPAEPQYRAQFERGIIAIFVSDNRVAEAHDAFKQRFRDGYPLLLTTDASAPVAFDVAGENGFFASNRVEGCGGFRVQPRASFAIWRHAQFFTHRDRSVAYVVPLAFVLGTSPTETPLSTRHRMESLVAHTVTVMRTVSW
jgi:hypothetical protein